MAEIQEQKTHVSTGAGIAIAGVWIAATPLTITILIIDHLQYDPKEKLDGATALFALLFYALPLIVAYFVTKRILGQHDD